MEKKSIISTTKKKILFNPFKSIGKIK